MGHVRSVLDHEFLFFIYTKTVVHNIYYSLNKNHGFPRYEVPATYSLKPQTVKRLKEETWGFEWLRCRRKQEKALFLCRVVVTVQGLPRADVATFCMGKLIWWDGLAFKLTLSSEYRNTIRDGYEGIFPLLSTCMLSDLNTALSVSQEICWVKELFRLSERWGGEGPEFSIPLSLSVS